MANKLYNRAKMTTATTGTGTLTLGSAVTGFLSFADAGASDADVISYVIADGASWEVGYGTYTASGTTLSRTVRKSSNSNSAISLSGSATVAITPHAEDLNTITAGTQTIWVPAAAMTARTTNGAASGTTELTTNDVMLRSFDFDTSTEEGVGFMIAMPKSWNEGTVTFAPYWTAASGSGGVVWGLAAYAFSNDDAMDTAVSGQQTSTDTLITANDCHVGPTSSAITIGGTPAANDLIYFEITREVANGSDTLGVDAKLLGIQIYYTTDTNTDT